MNPFSLLIQSSLMFLVLLQSSVAFADKRYDHVLEDLKNARPDFKFESIEPTDAEGIFKAKIQRGPVIYITEDGKHFFAGDFFAVGKEDIINVAERDLEGDRKVALADVDLQDMVIFKPKKTKAHLYVFTDADCYYCQKLHSEVAELNDMGIEIRYLAYPRAGVGSPSFKKIVSAWCADDAKDALTKIKSGKSIPENICKDNPIASQYDLGGKLGVSGTPALVTADGKLIAGYVPAAKLAKTLGL